MNCIIIDGNATDQNQLIELINEMPQLKLKATCFTASEAIHILQSQNIDLLFLNTDLPHVQGIEFAKSLINRPIIIFTAQNTQHAAEAFSIDAIDYLIKPLNFERFLRAVQKANEISWLRKLKTGSANINKNEINSLSDFVLLKADHNTVKINVNEILFVEGLKDYIKIHTTGNHKPVIARNSLKKILYSLPPALFSRIHKSFIVSIGHISAINKTQVYIGEHRIPIGESYRNFFLSSLQDRVI